MNLIEPTALNAPTDCVNLLIVDDVFTGARVAHVAERGAYALQ